MISFELALLGLLIAVIVILAIYVLYALEPSAKPSSEEKTIAEEKTPAKKTKEATAKQKAKVKKQASTQPQTDSLKCPHGFGYLKNRDKKATIPDECLACPKALECVGSSESSSAHANEKS